MFKNLAAGLYNLGRSLGLFRRADRRPRVFMYHRASVGTPLDYEPTLDGLRRQLAWLGASKRVVPLAGLIKAAPAGEGEDAVALTFDDGFANFLHVLGVLEGLGLPATLFVTAAGPAGGCDLPWFAKVELARRGFPAGRLFGAIEGLDWSRLPPSRIPEALLALDYGDFRRAVDFAPDPGDLPPTDELRDSYRLLNPDELRRVADSPLVEIGAHALTHPDLTRLDDGDLGREVGEGGRILERLTGRPVTSFAYPLGRYDDRTVEAVRAAGFERAVVVEPLHTGSDARFPALTFPRSGVYGDSMGVFRAKAQGLDELRR
jgi:peptidoglycan/xylan/chitin deacetylase (PgdA/CDA1 family)